MGGSFEQKTAGKRFHLNDKSNNVHIHDDSKNIKFELDKTLFKHEVETALKDLKLAGSGVVKIVGVSKVNLYLCLDEKTLLTFIGKDSEEKELNTFIRML